jgi:hypothetical protein
MNTTILIDKETRKQLMLIKVSSDFTSLNEVIKHLLKHQK